MPFSARPWPLVVCLPLCLAVCVAAAAAPDDDELVAGLVPYELPADTNDITSLTPKQAKIMLASFGGVHTVEFVLRDNRRVTTYGLPLNGLQTLSADTAKVLARGFRPNGVNQGQGVLALNGLTQLEADAARVLATSRATTLFLNGLPTLSADAAAAITRFKGQITLDGLATLSPEAARALAQAPGWDGWLPGVVSFEAPDSVAVAAALAAHRGPLCLPNLKRISAKTLSALIAKEDVEIPLIEYLELIPEPDGSENDDFVVPPGFQARQERERLEKRQR